VDIIDFLHHPWIFDRENVRLEDDGLIDVDYREERVNTMIKTVWSEFQEKNKVRIQFLCIVLDSTFDKPDDYLRDVMKVGDDIHQISAQQGEVFLAPIAVRQCVHLEDFQPGEMTFASITAGFVTRSPLELRMIYASVIT